MATNLEVMCYLRGDGGYVQTGDDYKGIDFTECEPFTQKDYEAAFSLVDKANNNVIAAKAALLARLGITADEAKLLIG